MSDNNITIHVMVQDRVTGDQWVEGWSHYQLWVGEEEAHDEVIEIMSNFNGNRRPHENPRDPISFVLEEVKNVD